MKNQIVEMVLYKVKPQTNLNFVSQKVNRELSKFSGFVSRQTFQSCEDKGTLLDWVIWESLEQAQKAAQELPQIKSLAYFMQNIEKVDFFDHFEIKYFAEEKETFEKNAVLELVVYKIKKEKLTSFDSIFKQVSNELKTITGFESRKTGVSFKEENKLVDFLIWEDLEKAQNSMKIVKQNQKILEFFEMNEETFVFKHFRPIN